MFILRYSTTSHRRSVRIGTNHRHKHVTALLLLLAPALVLVLVLLEMNKHNLSNVTRETLCSSLQRLLRLPTAHSYCNIIRHSTRKRFKSS
jgi:hypothetical protein